jgi:hypothetical protein
MSEAVAAPGGAARIGGYCCFVGFETWWCLMPVSTLKPW